MRQLPVRILLVACLLLHAIWAALEPITASDLWVALASGRWIVEHGSVPSTDVFSYTAAGAPWFNQEWLSQVAFYELYRQTGAAGLAAFKLVVVVSTFALAAWIAARRSGSLALAVASACLAAFVCRPFLDLRAQLATFPGALALMAILFAYRTS